MSPADLVAVALDDLTRERLRLPLDLDDSEFVAFVAERGDASISVSILERERALPFLAQLADCYAYGYEIVPSIDRMSADYPCGLPILLMAREFGWLVVTHVLERAPLRVVH